jgi:hypothetical protein
VIRALARYACTRLCSVVFLGVSELTFLVSQYRVKGAGLPTV